MGKKNEATREQARKILKNGILDMSIARLIQMSRFGLMGSISLSSEFAVVNNVFNRIEYDQENDTITFLVKELQADSYGQVSFLTDSIVEISGCEDSENPDEYLNINIKLKEDTTIKIRVLY